MYSANALKMLAFLHFRISRDQRLGHIRCVLHGFLTGLRRPDKQSSSQRYLGTAYALSQAQKSVEILVLGLAVSCSFPADESQGLAGHQVECT